MKFTGKRIEGFVTGFIAKPDPKIRAVLVFGPDAGLVRERGEALAKAVAQDLDDPFRVATLTGTALKEDPARLHDEMAALSFTGGRRVLRVREANDAVGALFDGFLDAPPSGDSLCVVEAGELGGRSSLRKAFEGAENAAAVPCYADEPEAVRELVRSVLGERKVRASAEAQDYLVSHLGGDRGLSRTELEKLALYAGEGGEVGLEETIAVVGDSAALTVQDAIFAAAEGDAPRLERTLSRAFEEGENAVGIIRASMRHFERLHLLSARIRGGMSPQDAMKSFRPPVHFKAQPRIQTQQQYWSERRCASALALLLEAERQCKRTGFPDRTLCSDVLLRLARSVKRK
ncbi:MAG TPA: DNA polymerase III subunit delta [Stellaceae bacterium]|nr:DNA polymerase III subunit delta [Stellaceae bacterium]